MTLFKFEQDRLNLWGMGLIQIRHVEGWVFICYFMAWKDLNTKTNTKILLSWFLARLPSSIKYMKIARQQKRQNKCFIFPFQMLKVEEREDGISTEEREEEEEEEQGREEEEEGKPVCWG